MPFASKAVRVRRRAEIRHIYGDPPCALQIMPDCRAVGGQIDYEARPPHPRSFEVDHIVSSAEAARAGWSEVETDALDNCQPSCRQCNREKSAGPGELAAVRATYVNPRFI